MEEDVFKGLWLGKERKLGKGKNYRCNSDENKNIKTERQGLREREREREK